ncbi:putative reverse transcriptase/RNA-dependent DNA polymerase [Citrus sinensis]|nr:putative reverse transcriptase/RNA-dependent DNA polymerase [Citrus sinensis]
MLGRQGWRLLTNPDSLVACLFKARYYLKTGFLEASLGSNPSYVWRSILAAQKAISQGSRIRIGGGREIAISQAPWLPDQDNGFITSLLPNHLTSATMDSLMVPNQRRWDFDVVADIFSNRDRELILQIPLGSRINQDDWYWLPDSKGQYTIRNCYKMLENQPSSLNSSVWRQPWQLPVPAKVKKFLWRTMANVIPTVDNLMQRRVEWQQVRKNPYFTHNSVANDQGLVCWKRPQDEWFKCNVDAAVFRHRGTTSFGAVIRSSQGDFIAAKSDSFPGIFDACEAEAVGIREALSWLKTLLVRPIIVEMDSLQVFNALHERTDYANGFGVVITDCGALAQSLGDLVSLLFGDLRTPPPILLLGWGFFYQVRKSGDMFHLPVD